MSERSRTSERPWRRVRITDRQRLATLLREKPAAPQDAALDTLTEFDAEAWMELLADQRQRIAAAAGVDPSRVKIQIGH